MSDKQDEQAKNTYRVSLPNNVEARSLGEAVDAYVETIVGHGLRIWTYSVETPDGRTFMVTGEGKVLGQEARDEDDPAPEPSD